MWNLHVNVVRCYIWLWQIDPAGIYLFKVNNGMCEIHIITWCEICLVIDVILVSLLITLNIFHTLSWCFHCWQVSTHWGEDARKLNMTLFVNPETRNEDSTKVNAYECNILFTENLWLWLYFCQRYIQNSVKHLR